MKLIPLDELIVGKIYKIDGRNLSYGLYRGEGAFVGIRNKFGSTFIDEELHWDKHQTHGTVESMEETEFSFRLKESEETNNHYEKVLFDYLVDIRDSLCTEED